MGILEHLNARLRRKNAAAYKDVFNHAKDMPVIMLSRLDAESGMPGYERQALVPRLPEKRSPKDGSPRKVLQFLRSNHESGPMTARTMALHLPMTISQIKNALKHLQRNNYVVQTNIEKGGEKDYEAVD